ncbi:protein dead ringer isoform X2 [Drosophila hydei]|uniref:Protein dead ringer isoform X2 n=1 Tax=Drosophila hydei TaxID=7224 RepID=A0A6J1MDI6_DROHY|nr:protein dead ringer isoform X2 [Drosophila hydei]
MQLRVHPTMDCSGRSNNNIERDSDLGDDLSHGDRTDDEMRDCDSVDGEHHQLSAKAAIAARLSHTVAGGAGLNFASPEQQTDLPLSHHHQLPPNHPLNALGSFMGIGGLHSIPNLQHSDVLEKLKMQVRDMKVGLMEQDYAAAAHAAAFGANMLPTTISSAFPLAHNSVAAAAAAASFGHAASATASNGASYNGGVAAASGGALAAGNNNTGGTGGGNSGSSAVANAPGTAGNNNNNNSSNNNNNNAGNGHPFSFASPTAPSAKEANSASNSSTSSEASNSSQQNNGWSFEEQYKQVRQLYEINDDPKRKEFLDDLFSFMQKRGTPINRLPIMAKSVLDLYELYNLVIARGGLVDVINKKLWQEIIKGLHLPSSITSAAFTLRTQYMKYLYPYECEKKNLSTPAELQAAIDGNRREGRRSSYGQYEAMHNQMPLTPISRAPLPGGMQQMSPLALVTHAAAANNQQAQAAAAAAAAHRRLMGGPAFGQMPNLVTQEIENRMMEYLQLIQAKKEQSAGPVLAATHNHQQQQQQQHQQQQQQQSLHHHQQQQQQQQRQRSQSPELSTRDALSAQVALWHMYHNSSPNGSAHTSPQQREALNLSDSPPTLNLNHIKRERERDPTPEPTDHDEAPHQPPPAKRVGSGLMPPGFPANFYLNPHNMAAVAAAAGFHHQANSNSHHHLHQQQQQQDAASDGEPEDDYGNAEHNTTGNSSSMHDDSEPQQLNGHHDDHHHHHHHHHHQNHLDKSDDSAIENSPSTSTTASASGGHRHSSPVSTKKKSGASKAQSSPKDTQHDNCTAGGSSAAISGGGGVKLNPLETLSLLSGMQFQVARNGTGANGEQQLIVNLELNGIKYSGVLVANTGGSERHDDPDPDSEAVAPAAALEGGEEPAPEEANTATAHESSQEVSQNEANDEETQQQQQQPQPTEDIVNGGSGGVGVGLGVGVGVGVGSLLKDAVASS